MPYIDDRKERTCLNNLIYGFSTILKKTGRLNYFLFKLAKYTCYSYREYRDFIGELEAAKLEIYRRQIAPYEDKKIKENGDVK